MPKNDIFIQFNTNALQASRQVDQLDSVLEDIEKRGRQAGAGFRDTGTATISSVINAIRNSPLAQPASLAGSTASINAEKQLTSLISSLMANKQLTRFNNIKQYDLQGTLNSITNRDPNMLTNVAGLRGELDVIAQNPKAAATNRAQAQSFIQQLDAQILAITSIQENRDALLAKLGQASLLSGLDKVRNQYQAIGINVKNVGDLSGLLAQLTSIDTGLAQAVADFQAGYGSLSDEEATNEIRRLAATGADSLKTQIKGFDKQVSTALTNRSTSVVDTVAGLYAQRFQNRPVDTANLSDVVAFNTLLDKVRKPLQGDILAGLRGSSIPEITKLTTARQTGTPADVATAFQAAESAINTRLASARSQLAKLSQLATTSGSADLQNLVTKIQEEINKNDAALRELLTRQESVLKKSGLKRIDELSTRLEQEVSLAAGSKRVNFTPDFQADFINRLDDSIFRYIQQTGLSFADTRFGSAGGRTLGQLAGGRDLVTESLTGAGFFSAETASARMNTLPQAIEMFQNDIRGFGLSEKDFNDAVDTFSRFALAIQSQYKNYEGVVDAGLSVESARRRNLANRYAQEGNYEGARDVLTGMGNLTYDRVTQPGQQLNFMDLIPNNPAQMTPRGRSDYEQNIDQTERLITILQSRAPNALQRFARFGNTLLASFGFVQATVGTVINTFTQLIDQANRVDRVVATVGALSGSFERFSQVLQLATSQQAKFGGTLEETLQGLTGLIPVSKRYSVDLEQLDNIARRLAIIDPLQGFGGASIALKEFFSGDITSLSRRFEIDRKTLNSIKAAGDQAAQLQKLDQVLTDLGISNELLSARTQTTAVQFDRLGSNFSNLQALAGKYIQTFVTDRVEVGDLFSDSSRALTNLLELEQSVIDGNASVANSAGAVARESVTIAVGVSQLNDEIRTLNEIRNDLGRTQLRVFTEEDSELIKQLYDISQKSGTPLVDLIAGLDAAGNPLNRRQVVEAQRAASDSNPVLDFLANVLSNGLYEPESYARTRRTYQAGTGNDLFPMLTRDNPLYQSNMVGGFFNDLFELSGGRPAFGFTASIQQAVDNASFGLVQALTNSSESVATLSDTAFSRQQAILLEQSGINYLEETMQIADSIAYGNLSQEEINDLLIRQIDLNKKLLDAKEESIRAEADAITKARSSIADFSATLDDTLTKQLNAIVERDAASAQSTAASLYMAAGGGPNRDFNNRAAEFIVKKSEELLGVTREQLYYLGKIQQREALITLERNKSVSAVTALERRYQGLNVTLGETAQLAVDFNQGISGLISGGLLGQLSIQDQLQFYRNQQNNPEAMNSQDAVFSNLGSVLGLIQQVEQDRLDSARNSAKDLKKLEEDAAEKRAKIIQDAEDDKIKLLEDYEEKKLNLLKDSEISKRDSKVSFYENLFGADNLSQGTLRQYSAQYEQFFAEASGYRNQGDFSKAAAVLEAGSGLLARQIRYEDELVGKREDIQDIDKEIASLKKEYANAESADDRRSIQDKIDKALIQKRAAQERITEIEGLRKLARDADEERLKQAREAIDEEKAAYEKSLEDRNKALEDALKEADDAYAQSAKDRAEQTAASNKAQILSFNDLVQLQTAGYSVVAAARVAANGGTQQEITNALSGFTNAKNYFANLKTAAGDEVYKSLTMMENINRLTPSINQDFNNSIRQIAGLSDYFSLSGFTIKDFNPAELPKAQKANTETMQSNTEAINLNTAAVRLLTLQIQRGPAPVTGGQ